MASVQKVSRDPATFIGILGGTAVCTVGVIAAGGAEGFAAMADLASVFITCGGALMSTFTAFSIEQVLLTGQAIKRGMVRRKFDPVGNIQLLCQLGKLARREGLLALENLMREVEDPLIQHGIQLTVDGLPGEQVEMVLRAELEAYLDRQDDGREILSFLAAACPAFGMIGTLIGLVLMLGGLEDPSTVGAGMAAALLTTLYGAVASNIVFLPLAKKLEHRSREEAFQGEISVQGCAMIAAGVDYRMIQDKLLSQLSDRTRVRFDDPESEQAA